MSKDILIDDQKEKLHRLQIFYKELYGEELDLNEFKKLVELKIEELKLRTLQEALTHYTLNSPEHSEKILILKKVIDEAIAPPTVVVPQESTIGAPKTNGRGKTSVRSPSVPRTQ